MIRASVIYTNIFDLLVNIKRPEPAAALQRARYCVVHI